MADDNDEDKTEPASGRKIEKAREEGSVAKSQELTSFAAMIIGGSALILLGPGIFDFCRKLMIKAFSFNHAVLHKKVMTQVFEQLALDALFAIMPFLLLLMLTAIGTTISMTGFLFTWNAVTPKLSKLDPIAGVQRIFSTQGFVQLGLSVLKASLVGFVAWIVISKHHLEMLGLIRQSTESSYLHIWEMTIWTFIWIASSMILIANDTVYGLGAGVWTRNGNLAYRMGKAIKAGRVWTNCYHAYPAHAAFGGYKESGIGRETHKVMLDHYQQTKNLLVSYSENKLGFF